MRPKLVERLESSSMPSRVRACHSRAAGASKRIQAYRPQSGASPRRQRRATQVACRGAHQGVLQLRTCVPPGVEVFFTSRSRAGGCSGCRRHSSEAWRRPTELSPQPRHSVDERTALISGSRAVCRVLGRYSTSQRALIAVPRDAASRRTVTVIQRSRRCSAIHRNCFARTRDIASLGCVIGADDERRCGRLRRQTFDVGVDPEPRSNPLRKGVPR